MKNSSIFLFILSLFVRPGSADTLNAAQAVEIGLENNYNIRIARNDAVKANNSRKLKIGSLLPYVRAEAGINHSETYAPLEQESVTFSAGGSLGWTLFDGFGMFYAVSRIEEQARLAETVSRREIESGAVQILTAFYNITSMRSLLDAARRQLAISRAQLEYMRNLHDYGKIGSRELLRQQVLVNADSASVAARSLDAIRALQSFNNAIGRSPDASVTTLYDSTLKPPYENAAFWYQEAVRYNSGLQIADIRKNIAVSQAGIANAAFWPVLAASGSFSQSWGDIENTRTGLGLSLSIPIFNGFRNSTSAQNARIDNENAAIAYEQTKRLLQAHIYQQWEIMNNAYQQIGFEREAVALAERSLTTSQEQFRLGGISDVQFREIQLEQIKAHVRLESARFQYKVALAQLEQLAGKLTFRTE